jgi:hypothetical protein
MWYVSSAVAAIKKSHESAQLEFMELDLASFRWLCIMIVMFFVNVQAVQGMSCQYSTTSTGMHHALSQCM